MTIAHIDNLEGGFSVRGKLNALIDAINGTTNAEFVTLNGAGDAASAAIPVTVLTAYNTQTLTLPNPLVPVVPTDPISPRLKQIIGGLPAPYTGMTGTAMSADGLTRFIVGTFGVAKIVNDGATDGPVALLGTVTDQYHVCCSQDASIVYSHAVNGDLLKSVGGSDFSATAGLSGLSAQNVDCSSDGQTILVIGLTAGTFVLHTSIDGGATLANSFDTGVAGNTNFQPSVSGDGQKMLGAVGGSGDGLYVSLDAGATWNVAAGLGPIGRVAISRDGGTWLINDTDSFTLKRSTNDGGSWDTLRTTGKMGMCLSADGSKAFFSAFGSTAMEYSTDSGTSVTASSVTNADSTSGNQNPIRARMSDDGQRVSMAAGGAVNHSFAFYSQDGGANVVGVLRGADAGTIVTVSGNFITEDGSVVSVLAFNGVGQFLNLIPVDGAWEVLSTSTAFITAAKLVNFFDDFVQYFQTQPVATSSAANVFWIAPNQSGSAVAQYNNNGGIPLTAPYNGGYVALEITATVEGQAVDAMSPAFLSQNTGFGWVFESLVYLHNIGNQTNTSLINIGVEIAGGSGPYYNFSFAGDSVNPTCTVEGASAASGATLVTDTWNKFRIDATDVADIKFYINGVRVAEATTFIATTFGSAMVIHYFLSKDSGTPNADAFGILADYVQVTAPVRMSA